MNNIWLDVFIVVYLALVGAALIYLRLADSSASRVKVKARVLDETVGQQYGMDNREPCEDSWPRRCPIYEHMSGKFFFLVLLPFGLVLHVVFRLLGLV